jgi:hypothetical protein
MPVKNYLVRSLYQINNRAQGISPGDYGTYKKMHELTLASLKKYIGGEWELILFEGEVDNAQQMFRDVFIRTHRLWSQQACNILFVDLDILAVGSVDLFDQYQHFTMFAQTGDERRGLAPDQFYNCGLRYFPHVMSNTVWDLGLKLYQDWNDDSEWDREQLIYSQMLLSQPGFVFKNIQINSDYQFNSYEFHPDYLDQYKLLHFHSSKGPRPMFALMKKYSSDY